MDEEAKLMAKFDKRRRLLRKNVHKARLIGALLGLGIAMIIVYAVPSLPLWFLGLITFVSTGIGAIYLSQPFFDMLHRWTDYDEGTD